MKAKLFSILLVSALLVAYSIFDMKTTPDIDLYSIMIDLFLLIVATIGFAIFAYKIVESNNK